MVCCSQLVGCSPFAIIPVLLMGTIRPDSILAPSMLSLPCSLPQVAFLNASAKCLTEPNIQGCLEADSSPFYTNAKPG